jgi:hypothetical protein
LQLFKTIPEAKRALNIVAVDFQLLNLSAPTMKLPNSARKLVPDHIRNFKIMSKRQGDILREPVAKRSKRGRIPSPDVAPTSSVAGGPCSVRKVPALSFPTLVNVAIKAFTAGLLEQTSEEKKAYTVSVLQGLPEHLLNRVWLQLIEAWPERMAHGFIVAVCNRTSCASQIDLCVIDISARIQDYISWNSARCQRRHYQGDKENE